MHAACLKGITEEIIGASVSLFLAVMRSKCDKVCTYNIKKTKYVQPVKDH